MVKHETEAIDAGLLLIVHVHEDVEDGVEDAHHQEGGGEGVSLEHSLDVVLETCADVDEPEKRAILFLYVMLELDTRRPED